MAHKIYDNFYLSNEVEDQFNSHLDLTQFCNVDNSLVGTAGMVRKINVYRATNGTEKLAMGKGNSKTIEVSFVPKEYRIEMAQNRFAYYDEEEMTDPMLVPTGVRHMGTDMFNTENGDVFGEFQKATMVLPITALNFDSFVDAQAMFNLENIEGVNFFAFVCAADMADIRKALKETLQYIKEYATSGYVGTVGGVNLYTKKDAKPGEVIVATKDAVTLFNKKGTEIETERESNIRKNTIYSRKYYLVALTDETKAVKISKTAKFTATQDATVTSEKVYYTKNGNGYMAVIPSTTNPKTEGLFELSVGK